MSSSLSATQPAPMIPRGLLFVVSSPSGAGKTTLSRRLLSQRSDLKFSVSFTTRQQRRGEQAGTDYHFVTEETFDRMVAQDEFAEWCVVHGRRYGTGLTSIAEVLDQGHCILLDVDYQGASKLATRFPEEARLIFILPPSLDALESRLRTRDTDSSAVIEQRLRKAREEIRHFWQYHYLVVNNQIESAYAELEAIYDVEQATRNQQVPEPEQAALAAACRRAARQPIAETLLSSIPE